MEEVLSLFESIKLNTAKGCPTNVVDFLIRLGYTSFDQQHQLLSDLQKEGYITRHDNPLSPYYATWDSLQRTPGMQYKMFVKLTHKAEQYLSETVKIHKSQQVEQDNLKVARLNTWGTWFSGIIAFASLIINFVQCTTNDEQNHRIASQDSVLVLQRSDILRLSTRIDSLSQISKKPSNSIRIYNSKK